MEKEAGDDDNNNNKKSTMVHWNKKYDAKGAAPPPHLGSFASENMQKLFNVNIDMSSEGDDDDDTNGKVKIANDNAATTADDATEETKVPKRKLAMLVSFLGSNYSGFQINADYRTLQAELELGLYRAGIISKMNFGHPQKYSWSNSARTDKGVHAAAQVCSFKGEMIFHNEMGESEVQKQLDGMRERVNEHLPTDVRVLDFERVTRMFCARTSRDKVRYQYMVPSYLLCSPEEVRKAFSTVKEKIAIESNESDITPMEASNIIQDTIDAKVLKEARGALANHRVTSEQMEQLKSRLKLFEGTNSFHNYTRRVGSDNAAATRYILSFAPLDPILVPGGVNDDGSKQPDTQWIPLQVVGQSFLLNQIRKMVSAAVDLARGVVTQEKIEQSFTKQCRMKVNVAPAQGLFLDRSYFELYNKHKVKNAPKHGDSRDRDILDWVEAEGEELPEAVRRIEEFKNESIIPHIVQEEAREGNFLKYIYAQDVLYSHHIYGLIDDEDKPSNNENDSTEVAGK
ncbi:hypothetical protein ACHAXR_002240 [Thalassiosira sp. AJA248-18]